MQSFASEAGLALERSRATAALGEALERERLIAQISLQLRSHRDEVARGARGDRPGHDGGECFVRLGEPGEQSAVAAGGTRRSRAARRCGAPRSRTSPRTPSAPWPWPTSSPRPS